MEARQLRQQANSAQQSADRAQERARTLSTSANQAEANADQAKRGVSTMQTSDIMKLRLSDALDRVVQPQQAEPVVAPAATTSTTAVPNAQGQITGTIVNTSA